MNTPKTHRNRLILNEMRENSDNPLPDIEKPLKTVKSSNDTLNDILKTNAINLAIHHKKHCDGQNCNVSLSMLGKLLEKAGISLTTEEKIINFL